MTQSMSWFSLAGMQEEPCNATFPRHQHRFGEICFDKCLPYKDFGQGFYLTDIREQAHNMALRKARHGGNPIVQEYEIEDSIFTELSDCNILKFDSPSEDWARFIIANRERRIPPFEHCYDIVIGPVADDGVAYVSVVTLRDLFQ